ncbi:MAG: phage major tail tube protein [Campylobacteraceae bacterium]|jgi:P2 family phage contractile tail tube protein|nr:phage major tail tube protein [Campylobacteraceae bacterium]
MSKIAPQIIQDVNVFVNGQGYLGVASSLKLPDIVQETIEAKGGIGMKYATGAINAMEVTFKLKVIDANLFLTLGLNTWKNKIPIVFKGSYKQDNAVKPISGTIKGDWESITVSELSAGSEAEAEIKMQVHFYELNINNKPVILVDAKNLICVIGDVDYLSDMRANLL